MPTSKIPRAPASSSCRSSCSSSVGSHAPCVSWPPHNTLASSILCLGSSFLDSRSYWGGRASKSPTADPSPSGVGKARPGGKIALPSLLRLWPDGLGLFRVVLAGIGSSFSSLGNQQCQIYAFELCLNACCLRLAAVRGFCFGFCPTLLEACGSEILSEALAGKSCSRERSKENCEKSPTLVALS